MGAGVGRATGSGAGYPIRYAAELRPTTGFHWTRRRSSFESWPFWQSAEN